MVKAARDPRPPLPRNPAHSQAPTSTRIVSSQTVAMAGRPSITPSTTIAIATAVSTRCLSTLCYLAGLLTRLLTRQAVTSFTARERRERHLELRQAEIWPQRIADVQLGVRQVPQQEIADAVITAGAYEQVRVRQIGERELATEAGLIDGFERQRATRHLGSETPRGLHDVPAAAITHRHLHVEPRVRAGELFARRHARLQLDAERVAIADESQAHLVLVQIVDLAVHGLEEQLHQTIHFHRWSLPVFAGEREQREREDAALGALLDDQSHRAHAFLVAGMPREAAGLGPPAVAVHNDRDVFGNAHGRLKCCAASRLHLQEFFFLG